PTNCRGAIRNDPPSKRLGAKCGATRELRNVGATKSRNRNWESHLLQISHAGAGRTGGSRGSAVEFEEIETPLDSGISDELADARAASTGNHDQSAPAGRRAAYCTNRLTGQRRAAQRSHIDAARKAADENPSNYL